MTSEGGQTASGDRAAEVADYVAAVHDALPDLSPSQRDDLLEDLPAHLAEVAAEDPAPLTSRLGSPQEYAAELRATVGPTGEQPRHTIAAWAAGHGQRALGRLRRVDVRVGPLIGYERASQFGKLLVPAWWVVRGYLAAMVVVTLLDRSGQMGLLPRLGGSTLAGLAILAGFVAGSIWLAKREPELPLWPRRAVLAASIVVVLFGLIGFAAMDDQRRWGGPVRQVYVHHDPYDNVRDIFVVDEHGRLLTEVRLLDQDGNPIDIGWMECAEDSYDRYGEPVITYPRCPEEAPWWAVRQPTNPAGPPAPSPAPPSPAPSPKPPPSPSVATPTG